MKKRSFNKIIMMYSLSLIVIVTLILNGCKGEQELSVETENHSESFHMAFDKIPPNSKTGFTNLSGLGGMSIGYIDVPNPVDFSPLFAGLPQDMCISPHWGYILEGSIRIKYADGKEETINDGEVFYWPAPHTAVVDSNVKLIDFSPDREFIPLMEHIAENMEKQSAE